MENGRNKRTNMAMDATMARTNNTRNSTNNTSRTNETSMEKQKLLDRTNTRKILKK